MGHWRRTACDSKGHGHLVKRLLLISFALLLLGATPLEPTEYEQVVSTFPLELLEGGCHNVGQNPDTMVQADIHRQLTSTYSWPMVTAHAINRIKSFIGSSGVVDFGAGNGYFAYLLSQQGVDTIAIDNWSEGKPEKTWHPVEPGDVDSLVGTSDRALLLSWPPKHSWMALAALHQWNGTQLIYAGEILRRTADVAFHRELAKNWRLVERVQIPQWRNFSDAIFLFERKDSAGVGWDWMVAEATAGCTYDPSYR
jgi:hypothetical protein